MSKLLSALDVLPGWFWALICSGLLALQAVSAYELKSEQASHAQTRAEHAMVVAEAASVALVNEEQLRILEQGLNHAEETHAAQVAAAQAGRDRALAQRAGDVARMQERIDAFAAQARQHYSGTGTPELRPTAEDPIGVFAQLLGRADQRADLLAVLADDRGFAGSACERRYDELQQALNKP